MKITSSNIDAVVLQLFIEQDPTGGTALPLSVLEREWSRTQLRRADLGHALGRLEVQGFVVVEDIGGEVALSLTPEGRLHTSAIPGLNPLLRQLGDFALFRAIQRRRAIPSAQGRRESDPLDDEGMAPVAPDSSRAAGTRRPDFRH